MANKTKTKQIYKSMYLLGTAVYIDEQLLSFRLKLWILYVIFTQLLLRAWR